MSRTIRRTTANKRYARFERDYTHQRASQWLDLAPRSGSYPHDGFPMVPLQGKAYQKTWWLFHSDNGLSSFGFEDAFERPLGEAEGGMRARYKREIHKWMRDPEYEIILQPRKQIWDLC